jgi:hypothetical protein
MPLRFLGHRRYRPLVSAGWTRRRKTFAVLICAVRGQFIAASAVADGSWGVAVDLDLAVLVVASLADEYPHPVEERAGQPGGYHGCEFRPRAGVSYPQPLGGGVFADAPAGDTPDDGMPAREAARCRGTETSGVAAPLLEEFQRYRCGSCLPRPRWPGERPLRDRPPGRSRSPAGRSRRPGQR